MIWAAWEVRLDFWSLAPRGDILTPLGAWLLLPLIGSHLAPARRAAGVALGVVPALAVIVRAYALPEHT
jgi:quinoprotein glucose dehydrogenase